VTARENLPEGVVDADNRIEAMAGKPAANRVVELARKHYRIVTDPGGVIYAVPKTGPRTALPLGGRGSTLTKRLSREIYDRHGITASPAAMQQALQVIEASAADGDRVDVHLRSARRGHELVIDLSDAAGRVAVVRRGGWRVLQSAPKDVLFRRTALTASMPMPSRRGDLDALRRLLNVTDENWNLIRAWLVMALLPDIPVPILCITGTQGSGKTGLGRMLTEVVDPSTSGLRSPPRDLANWQTTAAASRVVGIDNISTISEWFSDALCRVVTGEGVANRALYTDDEIHVSKFRRAVLLTSIDPGALRGDLTERLLPIELRPLRGRYQSEARLREQFMRDLPVILGGLFDLAATALFGPRVRVARVPRMADAATVFAAVDKAVGSNSLESYRQAQADLSRRVLDADPLAGVIVKYLARRGRTFNGTPTRLYEQLQRVWPRDVGQKPANARALSQRLRRIEPALADAYGITIEQDRSNRERRIVITQPVKRRRSGAVTQ
jgi:hypothetical protein